MRKRRWRSVIFRFRYAREGVVKRAAKTRDSRGVWWHAPLENVYFGGPKYLFPCFPRGSFIDQSIRKR